MNAASQPRAHPAAVVVTRTTHCMCGACVLCVHHGVCVWYYSVLVCLLSVVFVACVMASVNYSSNFILQHVLFYSTVAPYAY